MTEDEPDTGEIEDLGPGHLDVFILAELERIRYRLGVLIVFLVVVPLVVGFLIGLLA